MVKSEGITSKWVTWSTLGSILPSLSIWSGPSLSVPLSERRSRGTVDVGTEQGIKNYMYIKNRLKYFHNVLDFFSPFIAPSVSVTSPNTDEFLDLLASSQSRRLDDQRASFSNLPGLRLTQNNNKSVLGHLMTNDNKEPDEDFFDILVKCQVRMYIFVGLCVAQMLLTALAVLF